MLRAAMTSSIGTSPGPQMRSSASSTFLERSLISGRASAILYPSTTLYFSDLSRTCRSMSGRPWARSRASTDWQYSSHTSGLMKLGSTSTPLFQKSVGIPHHLSHSFVEAWPRVETTHASAQRRLSVTVLSLSPSEHLSDFVSMLLGFAGFDNDAVLEDSIVDTAGSGGNRNTPCGDHFEQGSHLSLHPCGDIGVSTGPEQIKVAP